MLQKKCFVFCIMAKQLGPFFITGTIEQVCFYKLDSCYYARSKSSLSRKRVLRDPAFKETRCYAELLGKASILASALFKSWPEEKKCNGLFRKQVGEVIRLLKEDKTADEITTVLQPRKVRKVAFVIKKENHAGNLSFGDEVLTRMFGAIKKVNEEHYCFDDVPT